MVLLLTDVFLLLTQVLLWLLVGLIGWFVLLRSLPRAFLSLLVLLLILAVLALSFFQGPPLDGGVLEVLWRVISFPFSPLGLGIILLLILLSGQKLGKTAKNLILLVLTLLALGSVPIVSYYLTRELEVEGIEQVRPQPALTVPGSRRVIVLLGQETTRPQLRTPQQAAPANPPFIERPITPETFQILTALPTQLTERGDRILYAAQLFQEESRLGTNPLIVVSAGVRPERRRRDGERDEDISEARDIQRFLTRELNVPEGSILLDSGGNSLRRSAERVQALLSDQQRGINFGNQLTLVTSALSMNRAVLTFNRVFNEAIVTARPTDFYTLPPAENLARLVQGRDLIEREIIVTDFLPTADAFYISSQAIEEYLNSIFYFLRGWIRPLQAPTPR
ncbi:YdcF family protein [Leptolyngbya sp. FACHB-36]|uniref:YdcF family protein n=1 Tax=Leptolyngbya sp. FACHB-36 TaxID=2692808 RepID=UPI00198E8961|nr:YdcF family protein [Leptolyngbya sp. FACHB-36]MBD2020906.1 YdcF family protein [Leptolyngbya sp. FACHB-36]